MKTDAKSWTPNHGDAYSPSKSQQTLCEATSGFLAVQSAPDCQTPSKSLLSSQPISAETEIASKHCAKRVCVCCAERFIPVGQENICERCESGDALRRTCRQCQHVFYADDPFDTHCSFCYDTNHLSD